MSADYNYFAPTGGRYQTVFRGTLPRRCSIKRSRWDNTLPAKYDYFHSTQVTSSALIHLQQKKHRTIT